MKKLLVIGGIAAFLLYRKVNQKVQNINEALKDIRFQLLGIQDVKVRFSSIQFMATIAIVNDSDIPVSINTLGVATLKRLIFRTNNGDFLGESFPQLSKIDIGPRQSIVIDQIPTQLPIKDLGLVFNAALNALANQANIKVTAEIETPAGVFLINE